MLVGLMYIPKTQEEWDVWSFHHRNSHEKIRDKLFNLGVKIDDAILDPIPFSDFADWLRRNQTIHADINKTLNVVGSDLSQLDLEDQTMVDDWIWRHFLEHQSAEQKLQI